MKVDPACYDPALTNAALLWAVKLCTVNGVPFSLFPREILATGMLQGWA